MSSSQNSRVIDPEGISYAVTNGHKDGEPKIIERIKPVCVGNMLPNKSKCGRDMQAGRIYDPNAISPCLTIMSGGNTEPKIIEPIGCAMRGLNPENSSERGRSNGKYKQRIEMGSNISNTITSVQKDSLVAEPQIWQSVADELKVIATEARKEPIEVTINEHGSLRPHKLDKAKTGISEFQVENEEDTASTLISARPNKTYGYTTSYRIRKLTPRECFRLMGVTETDIDKIQQSGVSQSQQYKMAGNSIVVDCLYHMFRKMFTETACESQQLSLF